MLPRAAGRGRQGRDHAARRPGRGRRVGVEARPRRTGLLYLDASALVKRYDAEPGSDLVRKAMG
jgi:hypothetical protein